MLKHPFWFNVHYKIDAIMYMFWISACIFVDNWKQLTGLFICILIRYLPKKNCQPCYDAYLSKFL